MCIGLFDCKYDLGHIAIAQTLQFEGIHLCCVDFNWNIREHHGLVERHEEKGE